MTYQELEQQLAQALERTAPDSAEQVLARCEKQEERVIPMTEQKTKPKSLRGLIAACLALVLAGGAGGVYYQQTFAVTSVVSLDVNPSIELKANRNERVVSCTPLNAEAAVVLFSMDGGDDLKGAKLDVAVNAIVGALVREGYLDSLSSAILISVEDGDASRAARLQEELVASVDGMLRSQAPGAAVLSQVLDASAAQGARTGGSSVSSGKASLVRKVMEMNRTAGDEAVFDQLALLSVEELNDLLETGAQQIPIGRPAACRIAEEYAGTLELDSADADADPELDEFPAHYDVELKTAWGEFDYKIDAWTGAVLSGQRDILSLASASGTQTPAPQVPDTQTPDAQRPGTQTPAAQPQSPAAPPAGTNPPAASEVTESAAKTAVLEHAGLSESQVSWTKVERDFDDGQWEYELEFWCGDTEYDYTVRCSDGCILKHEHETHYQSGRHDAHHSGGSGSAGTDVGAEAAKAAALSHAGLSESQTTQMKVKQDWDGGLLEYEVEFKSGGMEYEYTISGATGAVLEYKSEWDD